jgi:hypothetical protein
MMFECGSPGGILAMLMVQQVVCITMELCGIKHLIVGAFPGVLLVQQRPL